jgi:peptidoglycan L-alanyl-D-glutamate endopeptidase CwlK
MSAGSSVPAPTVDRDLGRLAPAFRDAVERAIADCHARGLDAYVYEAYRSPELQALYYARGRTVVPPTKPVTYAATNLQSWHGYGLAVDVISRSSDWNRPDAWFAQVAESFAKFGCRWGGEWKERDLPHFQWGACKPSPSDAARAIVSVSGLQAVWNEVGASTVV